MPRRTDPADWMWGEACELLAQAERMHRRFFRLTTSAASQALWEPPADVFEDEREVVVVVAMPGVAGENVEIAREPGALVVRAKRPPPFASLGHKVRQLEIPYGYFERRVALPGTTWGPQSHELTHGCLIVRLHKTG